MSFHGRLPHTLLIVVLVALPFSLTTVAQDIASSQADPSPVTRHAQVIAHGVMAMPAEEIGWRVTVARGRR